MCLTVIDRHDKKPFHKIYCFTIGLSKRYKMNKLRVQYFKTNKISYTWVLLIHLREFNKLTFYIETMLTVQ